MGLNQPPELTIGTKVTSTLSNNHLPFVLFSSSGRARSSRSTRRAWRKGRAGRERHGSAGESDAGSIGRAVCGIHFRIEKYGALILVLICSSMKENYNVIVARGGRLVILI